LIILIINYFDLVWEHVGIFLIAIRRWVELRNKMVVVWCSCHFYSISYCNATKSSLIRGVVRVRLYISSQAHIPILSQLLYMVFKERLDAICKH
jgi:hypothetical protein